MKKFLFLLSLFFFGFCFSQIDVEEIKKNVTEDPQKYFYDYLKIFKEDPSKLIQAEMNQLYYGSRFLKTEYNMSDYNRDYDKIWKPANKKGISKNHARKIIVKAEEGYSKNPLFTEILASMVNIYNAIGDNAKAKLCILQNNAIIKTIDESGTGQNENSPICVVNVGDMISFAKPIMMVGRDFKQKDLKTDKDCILTKYSNGEKSLYIKCIGCLNF